MRWLKLTFASLTAALVLSTPALAQSVDPRTGADEQYDSEALSVGDIPRAFTDPAARGTGSLNEALTEPDPSLDPADASTGSGSSRDEASAPESGTKGGSEGGKVAGLTVLPETGGAPLLGLGAGVVVSGAGFLLLLRRRTVS